MSALRNIFSNTLAAVSEAAAAAAAATAAPSSSSSSSSSSARGAAQSKPSIIDISGPLPPPTHNIERYIDRACSPERFEPDLALNLEICDLINAKGGSCPRIAAVRIVRHVNSTHANTVRFALDMLDMCAKNCGFPFHLQIASKDFLNTLVRRFPVQPPTLLSSAHLRTLELLEQWNSTFAQDNQATYADLNNVRRMHALLLSKGYVFPVVSEDALSMLARQAPVIRCADDLEAEDVAVMRARLQELLRKQRPEDLEEANRLVKQLVGYDETQDYGSTAINSIMSPTTKASMSMASASAASPGVGISGDLRSQQRQKYLAIENEDVCRAISRAKELEAFLLEQQTPATTAPLTVAELARSCRAARQAVGKIIESRDSDLEKVLELSDLLNRVLALHDGENAPLERAPSAVVPLIDLSEDTNEMAGKQTLQQLLQPVYMRNGLLIETSWTWASQPPNNAHSGSDFAASVSPCGVVECSFTNSSEYVIDELSWQIAVPKSISLKLGAISGIQLPAKSQHGALKQSFTVTENVPSSDGGAAKSLLLSGRANARFRVQFKRLGAGAAEIFEDEGIIPLGASATCTSTAKNASTTTTATSIGGAAASATASASGQQELDLLSI